jgi:glycosyltransferase involved in cell wall biosynthesis
VNLLHALKLLDGVTLALSGADKGNLAHVRRTAEALGVASRVRFLGFVTADQVAWLYRHALALVYPSFNGPDNLPPLEAFTLGCPVAMAAYPGAEEQAGDAALLFDPRDPASIARELRKLCDGAGLREELAQRGRARAAARTAAAYVSGVLDVLDGFSAVRRCW